MCLSKFKNFHAEFLVFFIALSFTMFHYYCSLGRGLEMGVLSLIDSFVALTLIINALALTNFRLNEQEEESVKGRINLILKTLRQLSFFILLWNVLLIVILII